MKNSLMKKYESMGFDKGQLEEIRQGVEKGLDVSWYTSVKYDWFQMEELRKGWSAGWMCLCTPERSLLMIGCAKSARGFRMG